jgi:hypothetical protein
VVVGGYLLFSAGNRAIQTYRLAGQEQRVRSEIVELQRQHRQLVALREYLRSNEYLEGVARRLLGLVRPGEALIIVSGPEPSPDAGSSSAETPVAGEDEREETQAGQGRRQWWEALFEP